MLPPENNTIGTSWLCFLKSLESHYQPNELQAIGREVFSHFFGLGPADRVLGQHLPFNESQIQTLNTVIAQLKNFVPLQHITGKAGFFGLDFRVDENVLIPRPETEELVQWVLTTLQNEYKKPNAEISLLDVGTGSGCIAIALAKNLPEARISACDISENALKLARENAVFNNVKVDFFTSDILTDNPAISDIDAVVSNPPYIRESEKREMLPNVLNFEPHKALFVSDNDPLLFYRVIAQKARQWLKPGGFLFFEINENLGAETIDCIVKQGFYNVELRPDINGKQRMVRGQKGRDC